MVASYPVLPLLPGHALAIGVTSYDGQVFYGLDADRDAVPDIDVLSGSASWSRSTSWSTRRRRAGARRRAAGSPRQEGALTCDVHSEGVLMRVYVPATLSG